MSIFENIKDVYKRISRAAMKADRDPSNIKLIAVTKSVGMGQISEAIEAGVRFFGENRVQEAAGKIEALRAVPEKIEWHMIGHLQKNKAKYAVKLFDLIHSVDSAGLADELQKQAEKAGKSQRILIEVKLSHEGTKHGVTRGGIADLLKAVSGMKNLNLLGLMTIPPFFEDPEKARPYFRELRELRDRLEAQGFHLPELSMGMSNDFETAIEEGATMVRVGTAIFGERS